MCTPSVVFVWKYDPFIPQTLSQVADAWTLQIVSGKRPLPDLKNDKQVIAHLQSGTRPQWPDALAMHAGATVHKLGDIVVHKLGDIVKCCWLDQIDARPVMEDVEAKLVCLQY